MNKPWRERLEELVEANPNKSADELLEALDDETIEQIGADEIAEEIKLRCIVEGRPYSS